MFLKNIETSDNGNAYYFLGEIEKNEGNFDKAEEYFKLSIDKNITNKYKKNAYWNLIIIEEQKGRYNEMAVLCRQAWDTMDDEGAKKKVEALINKSLWTDNDEAKEQYNYGIEYKKKNVPDKAKESFSNALGIDSNFLAAKFEIGLMLFNENKPDQAINYLKDIIEKIPFYGEVHLLLGEIYYNNQSYRNSIVYLENAIEYGFLDNKTKYFILLKTGTSYFELGEFEKAQEKFNNAIELNKKAVEPLLLLSAIYIKTSNFEQALSTLLKAKELNQNNLEIIFQIGSLYYKLNDQRYVQYFNLLFNKYQATKEAIPQNYFKAFILLLNNYYEQKKYEDVSKIINVLPESLLNNEINLIMAKTYYYLGKYDKAIEYFEKLSLSNDDQYLLCISYARMGKIEKAKDILWNLSNFNNFLDIAKTNVAIKKIAYEIENEKLKKEKENAAAEEKRKQDEEKQKGENKEDQPEDTNIQQGLNSNQSIDQNIDNTSSQDKNNNTEESSSPVIQNSQ